MPSKKPAPPAPKPAAKAPARPGTAAKALRAAATAAAPKAGPRAQTPPPAPPVSPARPRPSGSAAKVPTAKAQPAAKQVATPASQPIARPAARPAAKPVAQPTAKPAGKPAATPAPKEGAAALSTAVQQRAITNMKAFFERTLSALDEGDSAFAPAAGMFTTAQQVAHAAQTYDWFREGAFAAKGFRMDFPAMEAEVRKVTSLAAARAWLDEAHRRLLKSLQTRPAADWHAPIAKDTIMAGAPRVAVIDGLVDHTAHHRGALAVYARLRGKTPPMPYM